MEGSGRNLGGELGGRLGSQQAAAARTARRAAVAAAAHRRVLGHTHAGFDVLLWGRARPRRPGLPAEAVAPCVAAGSQAQMGPRAGPRRAERVGSGHRLGPRIVFSLFNLFLMPETIPEKLEIVLKA
jgi:hypothetical protein